MKFFLLILLKTLLLHPTNIILLLFFHQTSLSNCSTKKHQFHQASPLFFSNPKFKHRTKRKNFLASPRSCSPFFFSSLLFPLPKQKKKTKNYRWKKKDWVSRNRIQQILFINNPTVRNTWVSFHLNCTFFLISYLPFIHLFR